MHATDSGLHVGAFGNRLLGTLLDPFEDRSGDDPPPFQFGKRADHRALIDPVTSDDGSRGGDSREGRLSLPIVVGLDLRGRC